MNGFLGAVLSVIGLTVCSQLANASCDHLELDDAELANSRLFYGARDGWQPFKTFSEMQLRGKQTVEFTYVVREVFRGDRSGALVIKSGIYLTPQKSPETLQDRVLLVRKGRETDQGCVAQSFKEKYVSGKAYSDYHDYQSTETEELRKDLPAIEKFHITYRRGAGCIGTNDSRTMPLFPTDHNASQFSFDTGIVDTGARVGIRFNLFSTPAYGGPGELWQRRSEIRHYKTAGGLQCVRFSLPVSGDDRNFIRVNDLEGRAEPPSNRRIRELRYEN